MPNDPKSKVAQFVASRTPIAASSSGKTRPGRRSARRRSRRDGATQRAELLGSKAKLSGEFVEQFPHVLRYRTGGPWPDVTVGAAGNVMVVWAAFTGVHATRFTPSKDTRRA